MLNEREVEWGVCVCVCVWQIRDTLCVCVWMILVGNYVLYPFKAYLIFINNAWFLASMLHCPDCRCSVMLMCIELNMFFSRLSSGAIDRCLSEYCRQLLFIYLLPVSVFGWRISNVMRFAFLDLVLVYVQFLASFSGWWWTCEWSLIFTTLFVQFLVTATARCT